MPQQEAAVLDAWEDCALNSRRKQLEGLINRSCFTFRRTLIADRKDRGLCVPFKDDDVDKYCAHKKHLRRMTETGKFDGELSPS